MLNTFSVNNSYQPNYAKVLSSFEYRMHNDKISFSKFLIKRAEHYDSRRLGNGKKEGG
jgi:hypothetical protein